MCLIVEVATNGIVILTIWDGSKRLYQRVLFKSVLNTKLRYLFNTYQKVIKYFIAKLLLGRVFSSLCLKTYQI